MLVVSFLAAGLALAASAALVVRRIIVGRGQVVFQYPSGRPVPEALNPMFWKRMVR